LSVTLACGVNGSVIVDALVDEATRHFTTSTGQFARLMTF